LVILVSAGFSAPAFAQYNRTKSKVPDKLICLTWNKRDFFNHVDSAGSVDVPGDAELQAIEASFATWRAVANHCSDFTFARGDPLHDVLTGKNTTDTNVIVWREQLCEKVVSQDDPCRKEEAVTKDTNICLNKYHCWDHGRLALALTTTIYVPDTGAIYDSDIELNASRTDILFTTVSSPPCPDGESNANCVDIDIQNTLTHEIGHSLGFDHVKALGSTMYEEAFPGEINKRQIDYGTVEGFCTTYPKGGPPAPCDESGLSRRTVKATLKGTPVLCACSSSGPTGFALLMAFVFLSRLRRRRFT
jgi:MYXO-CTERM domain-containing protein